VRNGILSETVSGTSSPPIDTGLQSNPLEQVTWGARVLHLHWTHPHQAVSEPLTGAVGAGLFQTPAALYLWLDFIPSPWGVSRTFGSRLARHVGEAEESWLLKNRRRVYLIEKKYRSGLSRSETVELLQLQEDASRQVNARAPLPMEPLEALGALADRLEQGKPRPRG
jgi:hypothetical protein